MAPQAVKPLEHHQERLQSLDALRGFAMIWIIGLDDIMQRVASIVNNTTFNDITTYFTRHVRWEGFRFYDLIFPMFLFLMGVSIAYSIGNKLERGVPKKKIVFRIVRRTVILFCMGLIFYGALQFKGIENVRIFGVLQRLALGYFFAAIIVLFTKKRVQAIVCVALLLGYWALMKLVPVPGYPTGTMTMAGNLAAFVDQCLFRPGQLLWGTFDPEGLLSTIPAISTALLGVFTGYWLRSGVEKKYIASGLLAGGLVLLVIGSFWGTVFPVIKNLWTSSFVLVAGGWSLIYLGLFYLVIDVLGFRKWAYVFIIIGVNPITIYFCQEFINFYGITSYFIGGVMKYVTVQQGLVIACCVLLCKLLFLSVLKRHKVYLRI